MATETSGTQSHVEWRRLHALGLPSGSIRALLAILIFATTWGLLVLRPSLEVPDYLRDLLSYWAGVGVSLGWIALLGAAGTERLRRRDIT